jgi:hypothetical protein
MQRELDVGEVGAQPRAQREDVRGVGDTDGVGDRHVPHAHGVVAADHPRDPLVRHPSLERATQGGGHAADDLDTVLVGEPHDVTHAREGVLGAPVRVGPAVRVAHREHGLPHVGPVVQRALGTLEVRHEDGVRDPVLALDAAHHLVAVLELGYGVGTHERGGLYPRDAGAGEGVDDLDLLRGRDEGALELEPVTRTDLVDLHACGEVERQSALCADVLLDRGCVWHG